MQNESHETFESSFFCLLLIAKLKSKGITFHSFFIIPIRFVLTIYRYNSHELKEKKSVTWFFTYFSPTIVVIFPISRYTSRLNTFEKRTKSFHSITVLSHEKKEKNSSCVLLPSKVSTISVLHSMAVWFGNEMKRNFCALTFRWTWMLRKKLFFLYIVLLCRCLRLCLTIK